MPRQKLHFTPDKGWINDPNGLCVYEGEYHLCYQFYPEEPVWGPMHWGHAKSADLLHWEDLPIAIAPTNNATIFSGSAMIDSDWHSPDPGSMVAMYTLHSEDGESQGVSFCSDGINYLAYSGNPVIPAQDGVKKFRDPRLFRVPGEHTVRCAVSAGDSVWFFRSEDFVNWEKTGEFKDDKDPFKGVYECPDIFPLEGDEGRLFALVVSRNPNLVTYYIGDFSDGSFVRDPSIPVRLLVGRSDFYAATTFSLPCDDGIIQMAWVGDWRYSGMIPHEGRRGALTLPKEVFLTSVGGVPMLGQRFIPAIMSNMAFGLHEKRPSTISDLFMTSFVSSGAFKATLSNENGETLEFGLGEDGNVFIDRSRSGKVDFHDDFAAMLVSRRVKSGHCTMYAVYDNGILELLADDGTAGLTAMVFPISPYTKLEVSGASFLYTDIK